LAQEGVSNGAFTGKEAAKELAQLVGAPNTAALDAI
jgi:hypothetical protein